MEDSDVNLPNVDVYQALTVNVSATRRNEYLKPTAQRVSNEFPRCRDQWKSLLYKSNERDKKFREIRKVHEKTGPQHREVIGRVHEKPGPIIENSSDVLCLPRGIDAVLSTNGA